MYYKWIDLKLRILQIISKIFNMPIIICKTKNWR